MDARTQDADSGGLGTDRDSLRAAALAVATMAAAALAGAWFFQLALGLQPCPLCLEQRYAYYLTAPAALLLAAVTRRAPRATIAAAFVVLALMLLANAALGGYHAGVEWGFWPGPTDCSGPVLDLKSAGSLLDNLDSVKVVRCDEVQWKLFGLSLAGYNVLVALAAAAVAGWGARRAGT